jgi:hypothetical protein
VRPARRATVLAAAQSVRALPALALMRQPYRAAVRALVRWPCGWAPAGAERRARARSALPTFLYAMPFSPTRVFLEETSLVARPALGFAELRARLRARLAHLGVVVTAVEEEECCLIPMGGVLPRLPQRVLGIGGTAGMVHPSTGAWPLQATCVPALCEGSAFILGTSTMRCLRLPQRNNLRAALARMRVCAEHCNAQGV